MSVLDIILSAAKHKACAFKHDFEKALELGLGESTPVKTLYLDVNTPYSMPTYISRRGEYFKLSAEEPQSFGEYKATTESRAKEMFKKDVIEAAHFMDMDSNDLAIIVNQYCDSDTRTSLAKKAGRHAVKKAVNKVAKDQLNITADAGGFIADVMNLKSQEDITTVSADLYFYKYLAMAPPRGTPVYYLT